MMHTIVQMMLRFHRLDLVNHRRLGDNDDNEFHRRLGDNDDNEFHLTDRWMMAHMKNETSRIAINGIRK